MGERLQQPSGDGSDEQPASGLNSKRHRPQAQQARQEPVALDLTAAEREEEKSADGTQRGEQDEEVALFGCPHQAGIEQKQQKRRREKERTDRKEEQTRKGMAKIFNARKGAQRLRQIEVGQY